MDVIIPIGYAFFEKSKYSSSTLQKLLTIKRKEILYNKEKWKIYEDSYDKKWKLIFESMHESQTITLALGFCADYEDNNRYFGIIDSLINVRFTRLKELNLQNNNIGSVQRLSKIDMPQVTAIYLGKQSNKEGINLINTIRPLRRNNFMKLQYIDLSNNHIIELNCFSEFANKNLTKIVLQWSDSRVLSENVAWMSKLQVHSLKFIRLESKKRINQSNIDQMLLKREPTAQIWRKQIHK